MVREQDQYLERKVNNIGYTVKDIFENKLPLVGLVLFVFGIWLLILSVAVIRLWGFL